MNFQSWTQLVFTLLWLIIFTGRAVADPTEPSSNLGSDRPLEEVQEVCPPAALSRVQRHIVASGETIESIAGKYNLIPATLLAFNRILRQGQPPVGTQIAIPPYNGIAVRIPPGKTWRDVADNYDIRADALFEANGCQLESQQETPEIIFLPGVNWSPGGRVRPAVSLLSGYPLSVEASVALGYGWLLHPLRGEVVFHSGLDLLAEIATPVLSVGDGVIAFAGNQSGYGNLVVINHPVGKQTRYAHLESIDVKVGDNVELGEVVGRVGISGEPDLEEPHLHFEIRYNSPLGWVAENPNPYFFELEELSENID